MVVDGVFYIPSDALLPGISKIVLKDNELFAILDETGESPRIYDRELGFYLRDTRYLDTWELNLNGNAATALACEPRDASRSYLFVMTNKDIASLDYPERIPRDRLKIIRIVSLERDQAVEQVEITNYDRVTHTLAVDRRAGSRFHDIFEVRGLRRERRGEVLAPTLSADRRTVTLAYRGLDGKRYATCLWSPDAVSTMTIEGHGVLITHKLELKPRATITLKYILAFDREPRPFFRDESLARLPVEEHIRLAAAAPPADATRLSIPTLKSDNPLLDRVFATAAADVTALLTRRPAGLYPDAGIPWFCAPFGRDGLITAYQLLPWCPEVAEGVLEVAFAALGTKIDDFTDEEPGKVFHETRFGEMAALREVPFIPYYGSVDSTPLALILLGEYAAWTRRLDFVGRHWEAAEAALGWIRRRIAAAGFLTYQAGSPRGLRNQGWKDSHDSVMHVDGTLAEPPIALAEAQGYAYRALTAMARLAGALGRESASATWQTEAAALRRRFLDAFWDEERRLVVLALDGQGRPCRVMASNMGHCLWSGILDETRAELVMSHLLAEPLFSGHGIRTLASTEAAYNPLSYHNGSIWPHDNSLIAEGLRLYNRPRALVTLAGALLGVAEGATDARLPELFCGFPRYGIGGPVPYDVACKPQAWAAGTPFLLLKALLGLHTVPGDQTLVFRAPLLPPQLKTMEIRDLRVLDFEVDLLIRQGTVTSTVEVLRTTGGPGRVVVVK